MQTIDDRLLVGSRTVRLTRPHPFSTGAIDDQHQRFEGIDFGKYPGHCVDRVAEQRVEVLLHLLRGSCSPVQRFTTLLGDFWLDTLSDSARYRGGAGVSLLVDPAVLNQGANDLRSLQVQLTEALATIGTEHTRLKDLWTGAAADHVSTTWDELRPRLVAHIGKLEQQAAALNTVATEILGQDQANADDISTAGSSLDLP
ncbi:WXG100 family type VII secretion target [Nocardia sp. NPDC127579]|uniref:WXG100 family type VII secretion target n=1 Tax=Nocardia sp. NPDC127579 TaxID=3345402 RepID=UPI00363415D7